MVLVLEQDTTVTLYERREPSGTQGYASASTGCLLEPPSQTARTTTELQDFYWDAGEINAALDSLRSLL